MKLYIDRIIEEALTEDIQFGDVTSNILFDSSFEVSAKFLAKENFILAGINIARRVFEIVDPAISFKTMFRDGILIKNGECFADVTGKIDKILLAERVSLNFLQRLSGIATKTYSFVQKVNDLPVKIVDTRKTTPCLRIFEKYAVRVGGGHNHRFGLFDGVLIKDNHIKAAGGIFNAVIKAKAKAPHTMKIEVEVRTLEELEGALQGGADIIMLDNMDIETVKKGVAINNKKTLIEVSGGINLENVRDYALCGADIISVGALTHSASSVDISLKIS